MMKKILFLLFLGLSTKVGTAAQVKIAIIGFYNLENLFDTLDGANNDADFLPTGANNYTGEVFKDKLTKLDEVISLIGSDKSPDGAALLGVAEVENRAVLEALVKQPKIASRQYQIIHFDSPDERGIDVGLLYQEKYFNPLFSQKLVVPLVNDDGTPRHTRDVLHVFGLLYGEPIHVFVNHWPSRRGGEEASAPGRALAASICRQKIDSIMAKNPEAKVIVMGDLNDDPESPSCAVVIGAKEKMEDVKPGGMFNPWWSYYKEGIGTLAYNDSWNLFDQIMISHGWLNSDQKGFYFDKAYIFSKPWMVQQSGRYKGYPKRTFDFNRYIGGYSDHFPTYIVFYKKVK
jgi:hypothetical protein